MNANYYTNSNDYNKNINQGNYYKIGQQNEYPSEDMLNLNQNSNQNYHNMQNMNPNLFVPSHHYPNANFNTSHFPNRMQIPNYNPYHNIYQTTPNFHDYIDEAYSDSNQNIMQNRYGRVVDNIKNKKKTKCNSLESVNKRISTFNSYNLIINLLLTLTILALFGSIFELSSESESDFLFQLAQSHWKKAFEIINFFVNLIHIGGYYYGNHAFCKQNSEMNRNFELLISAFAVSNFVYLLLFMFLIKVTFFTWCMNILWLLLDSMLYFSAKELTVIFEEKEKIKIQNGFI